MSLLVGSPALGEAPTLSVSRNPSLGGRGVLSVAQPFRFQNLLPDGDMEAPNTDAWVEGSGAVLSKQTSDPHGGLRVLRVAWGSGTFGFATPAVFATEIGKDYWIIGYARSDGSATPKIYDAGAVLLWTGTTSTSWQRVDVKYTAVGIKPYLWTTISSAGFCEFDSFVVYQLW